LSQEIGVRQLGRTQLTISELGFGAAPLGNLYEPASDAEARTAVDTAISLGITYVDTAPFYGFGLSERRVGDALRGRSGVVLSTKVGRLLRPSPAVKDDSNRWGFRSALPFEPYFDYSFDGVLRSWESSLQRLGLARVDMLFIHDIGRATHASAHAEKMRQLTQGGGLLALRQLREQGAVAAVGLGVNEVEVCFEMLQEGDFDAILLAGRYTLLEQSPAETLFPLCEARGTSIVVGAPYNSGILATGTRGAGPIYFNYREAPAAVVERVTRLESVCDEFNIPLPAAALQFPLLHPGVASVIPGAASPALIRRNVELYQIRIPLEFWLTLQARGLIAGSAPLQHPEQYLCAT
jgi:D-threo-aldose 1-dehydrogenase